MANKPVFEVCLGNLSIKNSADTVYKWYYYDVLEVEYVLKYWDINLLI